MALNYLQQLYGLLKRLSWVYVAYFICRVLFFWANRTYFPGMGLWGLLKNCFYGLRFDSFSICVSNSLFILLSSLPLNASYSIGYQRLLRWIFGITNSLFILTNCIDIGYFPFIRKRSDADLFEQIGGQTDMAKLLPQYFKDFWWLFGVFMLLVAGLIFLYNRVPIKAERRYTFSQAGQWLLILFLFLCLSGFTFLGIRGGLQRVPIDIVNAGSATKAEEVPVVLNSPFTLIKSLEHKALEELNFYSQDQVQKLYNPIHCFKDSTFRKQNVVVIILESFAKEYTKLGHEKSLTPFLDSLMDHSLLFTNAFSNGSKSIEGIPAILSSLPSLLENPFINSIYANNKQTSLASVLKQEGYSTAFFHGGINGTMNFDDWAALAGYDQYLGKNEYGNELDFDHFWGIWDEPFLGFAVKKMTEMKQPFHTAVFTLSSHHPYFVPDKYKNKFSKGPLENSASIRYADYALGEFFRKAESTDWYKNTLFVLTADHASLSTHPFFSNIVGNQSIPILFFRPDNSLAGTNASAFSQMDILPSTLRLLGYNKPFFAYGQAVGTSKDAVSYFYANSTYYLYTDSLIYYFNSGKAKAAFNYRQDSTLVTNVLNRTPALDSSITKHFRAFIQTYNHTLIGNSGQAK